MITLRAAAPAKPFEAGQLVAHVETYYRTDAVQRVIFVDRIARVTATQAIDSGERRYDRKTGQRIPRRSAYSTRFIVPLTALALDCARRDRATGMHVITDAEHRAIEAAELSKPVKS